MGKLTLIMLALLVWLQYSLWFGKNGIHDYTSIKNHVDQQQVKNTSLKVRNDQLTAEIEDLDGGQQAIEERARNELTMIKPGETFYRLVPNNPSSSPGGTRTAVQTAPLQPAPATR